MQGAQSHCMGAALRPGGGGRASETADAPVLPEGDHQKQKAEASKTKGQGIKNKRPRH